MKNENPCSAGGTTHPPTQSRYNPFKASITKYFMGLFYSEKVNTGIFSSVGVARVFPSNFF
jgi:hypothetical protein